MSRSGRRGMRAVGDDCVGYPCTCICVNGHITKTTPGCPIHDPRSPSVGASSGVLTLVALAALASVVSSSPPAPRVSEAERQLSEARASLNQAGIAYENAVGRIRLSFEQYPETFTSTYQLIISELFGRLSSMNAEYSEIAAMASYNPNGINDAMIANGARVMRLKTDYFVTRSVPALLSNIPVTVNVD